MIILPFLSATLLRLKNKIATETIQLKLMRLAPPNTYPPMKFRQMELGIDFWKSQLRIHEHLARKYDPDQPRVPASAARPPSPGRKEGGRRNCRPPCGGCCCGRAGRLCGKRL
jgi:hypothetical protein